MNKYYQRRPRLASQLASCLIYARALLEICNFYFVGAFC